MKPKNNILRYNNKKNEIIPERLKQAREIRGFTITELADKLGITRQAIYQYENGNRSPQSDILNSLVDLLNFPFSFFVKPIKNDSIKSTDILFRALKSAPQWQINKSRTTLILLNEIFSYIENYIDFPKIDTPDIIFKHDYCIDDIEKIANKIRFDWGLGAGPISNLTFLMEKHGIVVGRAKISEDAVKIKLDACSLEYDNRPFILVVDNRTAVRTRFNIAHEFGHILMHMGIDGESLSKQQKDKIEKEANRFAGALLLPKESLEKEVISTSLGSLIALKKRWKVSIQAIAYRCMDLGIFTEHQFINIRKNLSRKKMITFEPLDDVIQPEQPSLFKQAVLMLLESNSLSKRRIVNEISLHTAEAEKICSLPKGTLATDNIIPLSFKTS